MSSRLKLLPSKNSEQPEPPVTMPATASANELYVETPANSGAVQKQRRRRRKEFTLKEKLAILHDLDTSTIKRKVLAKKWNASSSLFSTILKQRERILQLSKLSPERHRLGPDNSERVDDAMAGWLELARSRGEPITELQITDKANEFAGQLGCNDFDANIGWLSRFMRLNNISGAHRGRPRRLPQSYSPPRSAVSNVGHLVATLNRLAPEDIFFISVTALLYRRPPGRVQPDVGDPRLTVLLCCNADGSEKRSPIVMSTQMPSTPCSDPHLHVTYHPNAWMTSKAFSEFLQQLDQDMMSEQRNVVILVDRECYRHNGNIRTLHSTTVKMLPVVDAERDGVRISSGRFSQPMELGIVSSFKTNFRRGLLQRIMRSSDANCASNFTVDEAIGDVIMAWKSVSSATIELAWTRVRLTGMSTNADRPFKEVTTMSDEALWRRVASRFDLPGSATFVDYVNCDDSLPTWADFQVSDSAKTTKEKLDEEAASSDSDDCDTVEVVEKGTSRSVVDRPTRIAQVVTCVETLRDFVSRQEAVSDDVHTDLDAIEDFIFSSVLDEISGSGDEMLVTNDEISDDSVKVEGIIKSDVESAKETTPDSADTSLEYSIEMSSTEEVDKKDPDIIFALNLVSRLKKLNPKRKARARLLIQQVMLDVESGAT